MPHLDLPRIRRAWMLLAGIACSGATALRAQSDQIAALAPQCPTGAAPVIDTTLVTVGIWPARGFKDRRYDEPQQLRIRYYADAIRRHFTPPASLGELPMLGDVEARERRRDSGERSALSGSLVLVVKEDGRLGAMAWETTPLSAALANAVTVAAAQADSAGDFDGIPRAPKGDDTLALVIESRTTLPAGAQALMRARVAGYVLDRTAAVVRQAKPEYPENARSLWAGNKGRVRVIIGSDGRALMSSAQVTRTDWADFVEPMRAAVAGTTFRAAVSGGCTVPTMVVQPFEFRLGVR